MEILLASGTHIIANTFVQTTSGGGGSNISCSGIRVFLKSVKSEDGFVTMRVYQDTGGNLNLLGSSGTVRQHTANFTVVKVAEVGQL